MQIVIDMPDTYITENIIRTAEWEEGSLFDQVLRCALKKAIILPKGHGRLIDMKRLIKFVADYCEYDAVQLIRADREDYLPTIIEADKV